ncbi:MAG: serine--tRNA ligase [Thermoplasmata archaeon]
MIDIELLRESPQEVLGNLARRQDPSYVALAEEVRRLDEGWREARRSADALRQRRNELSRSIAEARRRGAPAVALETEARELPGRLEELARREEELRTARDRALRRLPNLIDPSVPVGRDDRDNVVVSTWGEPDRSDRPRRSHGDLLEALGLAEFDRARRCSGAGFYYLKGDAALVDLALQRFALDLLVERGFVAVAPPILLRREPYEGVTDLADFEKVMYPIAGEDLYLIATSEHPLATLRMGEILDEDELPIRLAGVSPCFRKEIGGHGVDQKGIFRVHQFQKVEQFVYCRPEDSPRIHEELRQNAEEIFRRLGIPYRVVNVCTGDLGTVAAKKYDIEAWFAKQQAYREVVSCSNCTDYQARRLGIRLGRAGRSGKRVPHTLNSTAIATSRALAAIVEQYQRDDGSVEIPAALRPYVGGRERLGPPGR